MRAAGEPTEVLHVRVPRRLVTAVAEAAAQDCKSVSEFARQALLAAARSAGVPVKREGHPDGR
jgi:predicted HicB family RNase H-like nuclease